jgi:dynein heavy chain
LFLLTLGDEFLPWGSLKYLIGDAMYGGRVSDDMDRRVLSTYLEEYMGDFLFDDTQKFSFSKVNFIRFDEFMKPLILRHQVDFDYVLPEWGDVENYTQAIEGFAMTNSPAVFGLHPNAGNYPLLFRINHHAVFDRLLHTLVNTEIGYYSNAVKRMWMDLISLQPRRPSSGEGVSREGRI